MARGGFLIASHALGSIGWARLQTSLQRCLHLLICELRFTRLLLVCLLMLFRGVAGNHLHR
jgi:hypothetical protein